MKFTGNLIETLMATVERAEQRTFSDEPLFAETFGQHVPSEAWLGSLQQSTEYDSKLFGVA